MEESSPITSSPEELFKKYWGNGLAILWSSGDLKRYIRKYPITKKYVDEVVENFRLCIDWNMDYRGRAYKESKEIIINPLYNDDVHTLVHEIIHMVYIVSTSFSQIERREYERIIEEETKRILGKESELVEYIKEQFGFKQKRTKGITQILKYNFTLFLT